MKKKILIVLLISIIVFAFPYSILELSIEIKNILRIIKGIILALIIFFFLKKENFGITDIFSYKLPCKIYYLFPAIISMILYIVFRHEVFVSIIRFDVYVVFLILSATYMAAFTEELIFRGYILNLLIKNKLSVKKGILISAVLFSSLHLLNILRYEIWALLNQLIFAFFVGLLFGALFILTKNIMIPTIMHFIFNIPARISELKPDIILSESEWQNMSITDNITSMVLFNFIFSPFYLLAFFYLVIIKNNYNKNSTA